jgi:hypothetical protein
MSEPTHIRDVLPDVLRDIEARCNRHRKRHGLPLLGDKEKCKVEHEAKVVSAVGDFMKGWRPGKRQRRNKRPVKQNSLF